jgi:hypothetical protein
MTPLKQYPIKPRTAVHGFLEHGIEVTAAGHLNPYSLVTAAGHLNPYSLYGARICFRPRQAIKTETPERCYFTTRWNEGPSVNCRKRMILPSLIRHTCAKGTVALFPVALCVTLYSPSTTT